MTTLSGPSICCSQDLLDVIVPAQVSVIFSAALLSPVSIARQAASPARTRRNLVIIDISSPGCQAWNTYLDVSIGPSKNGESYEPRTLRCSHLAACTS